MDLSTIANLKPVLGYNIAPQAVNELSLLGISSITIPTSGMIRLSQLPVDAIGNLNNMGNQTALISLSIAGATATQVTNTNGKTLAQVISGLTTGQFFVIFGDIYFSVADEGKVITTLTYNSGGEIVRETDYNNALSAIQFLATQVPLQANALTDYDPTQYPKRLLVLNSNPPGLYISDGTAWSPVSGSTLGFSVVRVKPNSVGFNNFVIQLSYNQGQGAPTIKRILDNGTAVDVTSSLVIDTGYFDDDLSSLSADPHSIYYNISDASHVAGYNSSPININLTPPSGSINVIACGLNNFTVQGTVNVPRTQSAVSIVRIAWATGAQTFDQAVAAGQYIDLTTAADITAFIGSGITKDGSFVGGTAYTFGVNIEETLGTGTTNWSGWATGDTVTAVDQPPAAVSASQIAITNITPSGCTVTTSGTAPFDPDDLGATITFNVFVDDSATAYGNYTWAQLQTGVAIIGQSWPVDNTTLHTVSIQTKSVNGAKTETSTKTPSATFVVIYQSTFDGTSGSAPDPSYFTVMTAGAGTAQLNGSGQLELTSNAIADGEMVYRTNALTLTATKQYKRKFKTVSGSSPSYTSNAAFAVYDMASKLGPMANADTTAYNRLNCVVNVSSGLQVGFNYIDTNGVSNAWDYGSGTFKTSGAGPYPLSFDTYYWLILETNSTGFRFTLKSAGAENADPSLDNTDPTSSTGTLAQTTWVPWASVKAFANSPWLFFGDVWTDYHTGKSKTDAFIEI